MNENIDPNDVVKRVLLMMKYDSNRTLTENKEIILEREGCANSISKEEFLDLAKETIEEIVNMEELITRQFNQVGSAQLVYDNVKYISKYNVYDSLDGTCENGIYELKRNFKNYYSSWFRAYVTFSDSLIGILKNQSSGYYNDIPEVKRYLDATIRILQNPPKVGDGETTKLTDSEKLKKAQACGHKSWEDYKNSQYSCVKTNKPSDDELLRRAKSCGHKTVESYKNSGWKCTKGGVKINKSDYRVCNSFPYTKYCKSPIVKEVQKCLGVTDDSYFGPITDDALFRQYGTHSLTQSIYKQIMNKCKGGSSNNTSSISNDDILQSTPSTDEV